MIPDGPVTEGFQVNEVTTFIDVTHPDLDAAFGLEGDQVVAVTLEVDEGQPSGISGLRT